jgi:hypothetical protein
MVESYDKPALGMAADTGLWLMHVPYERTARPRRRRGNALMMNSEG